MRYAIWPGCVSKAGTPELFPAATAVADKIGMDLVELDQANCTGAGVLGERNEELVDTLNARNFAMAEQMGLDTILTICSTCQGVMSAVNYKLREKPEYLAKINENLKEEGLEYKGTVRVTHMMWAVVEELGLDKLSEMVVNPLTGLRIAPFYGCYILRPRYVLGMDEHPDRTQYLEKIIDRFRHRLPVTKTYSPISIYLIWGNWGICPPLGKFSIYNNPNPNPNSNTQFES